MSIIAGTGNRCGHNPDAPTLQISRPMREGKKGHPGVLTQLAKRLQAYYDNPFLLPSLNAANGSRRQQRSERREAVIRLLTALLKFTDLASLRVGVPTDQGFRPLTVPFLARAADLSHARTERAMRDLKAAGILKVSQVRELRDDGSWKAFPAIRAISKYLWGAFGLLRRLEHQRKRAAAQGRKAAKKANVTLTARSRNLLGLTRAHPATPPRPRRSGPTHINETLRNRLLATAVIENPDWPPDRVRAHVDKLLNH